MYSNELGGAVRTHILGAALAVVSLGAGCWAGPAVEARQAPRAASSPERGLIPTPHPAVPTTWAETWLVPEPGARPGDAWRVFAQGVRLYEAGSVANALASFDDGRLATTPLAGYARYYAGLCARQLQQPAVARARFDAALTASSAGDTALAELARLGIAELAESSGDPATAATHYEFVLTRLRPAAPDLVLAGLVRSALAAGDRARAESAALRLYYEFPTSAHGETAAALVADLRLRADAAGIAEFFKRDLARGERLFSARQWDDARRTFEGLRSRATGDELEVIDLRIAECDQRRGVIAPPSIASRHTSTRPHVVPRRSYYYLMSLRGVGNTGDFVRRAWSARRRLPRQLVGGRGAQPPRVALHRRATRTTWP